MLCAAAPGGKGGKDACQGDSGSNRRRSCARKQGTGAEEGNQEKKLEEETRSRSDAKKLGTGAGQGNKKQELKKETSQSIWERKPGTEVIQRS